MELSNVKKMIISPQSSNPNIVVAQDTLLGAYDMTIGFIDIDRGKYNDIIMKLLIPDFNLINRKHDIIKKVYKKFKVNCNNLYTGKSLFSLILPEDFCYENNNKVNPVSYNDIYKKSDFSRYDMPFAE
jgi:DNA-directed RNA polymerase beta' subunit